MNACLANWRRSGCGRIRFERRMTRYRRSIRKEPGRFLDAKASMFGWFQFVREYGVNEGLVREECRPQVFG